MRKFFLSSFLLLVLILGMSFYKSNRDERVLSHPVIQSNKSAILVVHLETAIKRGENINNMFRSVDKIPHLAKLPKVIIDAVDGRKLNRHEIDMYYKIESTSFIRPYTNNFKLLNTEIGCFLSHRKAWQYIIDNNLDSAIIRG